MDIFHEIFWSRDYDPPPGALKSLREISQLRVLDLGGNIGLFGVDALSRYPSAQITSYEPDPGNIPVITRCIALNPGDDWTLVEAAAMTSDGTVRFEAGNFADSRVSDSGIEVPGVDILPILGSFDYVKSDVEGSEWPILTDPRWPDAMRGVKVFVVEWHKQGGPADAREAAIAAVARAGFETHASPPGWDNGLVWGWRDGRTEDSL